jgi:hypothetical protein
MQICSKLLISKVSDLLETFGLLGANVKCLTWDPFDPSARKFLWEQLPQKPQHKKEADMLAKGVAAIIAPAVHCQSFKGGFTLGARKSNNPARKCQRTRKRAFRQEATWQSVQKQQRDSSSRPPKHVVL